MLVQLLTLLSVAFQIAHTQQFPSVLPPIFSNYPTLCYQSSCYDKLELIPPPMVLPPCEGPYVIQNCGSKTPCNKILGQKGCNCHSKFESLYQGCGCNVLQCDSSVLTLDGGCVKQRCNSELVLPSLRVELPRGLGYFPAAVPEVASYYKTPVQIPAYPVCIPVTSQCSGLALASPVCPDIAPLVRPVIL